MTETARSGGGTRGRRGASLGTKLAVSTLAVVAAVAVLMYFELSQRVWDNLVDAKERSAVTVADLFATSIAPAVHFGDEGEIQAEVEYLRSAPDVVLAIVWSGEADAPVGQLRVGDATGVFARPRGKVHTEQLDATGVTVIRHLDAPDGTVIGHALIRFTLAPELRAYRDGRQRMLLLVGGLAVVLAALLIGVARVTIVGPLRRLTEAAEGVERGEGVRVKVTSSDEIGVLGDAFNAMATAISERERELQDLSLTDPLTKLRNRRFFNMTVESDVARVVRQHDPRQKRSAGWNRDLGLYMVDLDWFKKVNDTHGHLAGDEVLMETAERLETVVRQQDSVVRWGGEEFLVVARQTQRDQGEVLAQRILAAIGKEPFRLESGVEIRLTCSVGWAAFPWLDDKPSRVSIENVVELSDRGLYLAKKSGRNRGVGVMPPSEAASTEPHDVQGALLAADLATLDGSQVELVRSAGPPVRATFDPTRHDEDEDAS